MNKLLCMHAFMRACAHAHVCVCVCACVRACVCACVQTCHLPERWKPCQCQNGAWPQSWSLEAKTSWSFGVFFMTTPSGISVRGLTPEMTLKLVEIIKSNENWSKVLLQIGEYGHPYTISHTRSKSYTIIHGHTQSTSRSNLYDRWTNGVNGPTIQPWAILCPTHKPYPKSTLPLNLTDSLNSFLPLNSNTY